MKTKTKSVLFVLGFAILSGCASTSQRVVVEEAKQEPVLETAIQVQEKFREILDQDATVLGEEKNKIRMIVGKAFARYRELEILSNQKKTLLVKETLKAEPDFKKIRDIRMALKKSYGERTEILLSSFDEISIVLRKHPDSAKRYIENFQSIWPMRERAP